MRTLVLLVEHRDPVRLEVPERATLRVGRAPSKGGPAGLLQRGSEGAFELVIDSDSVSAMHAEIRLGDDGATVCDLGSTNGTFLQLSPGEQRNCTARLLLGPDVAVELRDDEEAAHRQVDLTTADDLRAHVTAMLGARARAVHLSPSAPTPGPTRSALALQDHQSLVVEWASGTLELGALRSVREVVNRFNTRARDTDGTWSFTAKSPARRATLGMAKRAAPFELSVLLLGSPGAGKGVLARDIHDHSFRAKGPFVRVNCGAIPQDLFESQLFGHAKGAFTGAAQSSAGYVDAADGGTLFLDEIGELTLPAQAKLLQLLDSGEYYPVGSPRLRRADVRIIAATNRDLDAMMPERFREDLHQRLAEVILSIPDPAPSDLHAAVAQLIVEVAARNRTTVAPEEVDALAELACMRSYKGHFRELRGALGRYLFLRDKDRSIRETWVLANEKTGAAPPREEAAEAWNPEELPHIVRRLEDLMRLQLARETSSVPELAKRLSRTPAALYTWLSKRQIAPQDLGDTAVLRDAVEAEITSLAAYRPLLDRLFRG